MEVVHEHPGENSDGLVHQPPWWPCDVVPTAYKAIQGTVHCESGSPTYLLWSLWHKTISGRLFEGIPPPLWSTGGEVEPCSRRLTRDVLVCGFPRELGHLRSASSLSTWKEVHKGAPSRPFALRRSSQLARNIKEWRTSVSEHRERMLWRWSNNWVLNATLIACAYSGCASKTTRVCVNWKLRSPSQTSKAPFKRLKLLKRLKAYKNVQRV